MIDNEYLLTYIKNYKCKANQCFLYEDLQAIFNHFVQEYGFDRNVCMSIFKYGITTTVCNQEPYVGQSCYLGIDIYNGLVKGLNDLNNKKRSVL